jgi:anti-sigma factor RsiW
VTLQHPHAELSAYLDGALDPAAQAAVDGHLVACALCRAHLAQLRATVAFVKALPDPVPSRRLMPRLAAPAWLAPLRTLMTIASGAAVFIFIASSLVTNITFLTSGGSTGTSAQEASRDTAANAQAPKAAQPAGAVSGAPAPAASPNAAFAVSPSASPVPGAASAATAADAAKRVDQTTAGPSGAPGAAAVPQDAGRLASSEPQRTQLLNPWLWLALAFVCGAIAIALHRRLRASV